MESLILYTEDFALDHVELPLDVTSNVDDKIYVHRVIFMCKQTQ